MKEYEKCKVCGQPIKTSDPDMLTFQVCCKQCLDEITTLILPRTSPSTDNIYREDEE